MGLKTRAKIEPIPPGAVLPMDEYEALPTEIYERCSIILHSGLQFSVEGSVSEIFDRMQEKALGFISAIGAEALNDGRDRMIRVSEIAALAPLPSFERKVMPAA